MPITQVTARVQYAGWNLTENELAVTDHDGVTGVGTALITNHIIGSLGEHIDELPLTLVSPLRPHDHHAGGPLVEHVRSPV